MRRLALPVLTAILAAGAVQGGGGPAPPGPDRAPVEGVGLAFPEDPGRGPVAEVALPDLDGDATLLEGRYVRVRSIRVEPGASVRARLGPGDFRYEPGPEGPEQCTEDVAQCALFDAVNVYWHVHRAATAFWRDRMGVDPSFRADAVVHLTGNDALADPARNLLQFRLGETYSRNAALEDDIIYHEYAHLVTASLGFRIDTTATQTARAVNEGIADYFAATFTDDPGIGEYLKTCTPRFHCIGPEDDPDIRTLDTFPQVWNWRDGDPIADLKYGVCTRYHPGDGKCKTIWMNTSAVYVWGMIWGSTLWDLRKALGADVADRLVLGAVRLLTPETATLERASGAILEADASTFSGEYAAVIDRVFADRGIRPEWVAATGSATDRPDRAGLPGYPGHLGPKLDLPYPVPASGRVVLDAEGVETVRLVDALGRTVHAPVTVGSATISVDVSALAPGTYRLVAVGAAGRSTRAILVAR